MATSRKTSTKARSVDLEALDLAHMFHPNTNLAALHAAGRSCSCAAKASTSGTTAASATSKAWPASGARRSATATRSSRTSLTSRSRSSRSRISSRARVTSRACCSPTSSWSSRRSKRRARSSATPARTPTTRRSSSRWYYHNVIGQAAEEEDHRAGTRAITARRSRPRGSRACPAFHKNFDVPMPGILHTDAPYYYRGAEPGESEEDYASRLARNLEKLIEREGPDTIAAFIAEPLMGVGGVLLPPRTYFEKIQAVLARYDDPADRRRGDHGLRPHRRSCGARRRSACGRPRSRPRRRCRRRTCRSARCIVPEFLYEPMIAASGEVGLFGHGFTYSGHPSARRSRCARCKSTRSASSTTTCARSRPSFNAGSQRSRAIRSSATRAASASSARASSCATRRPRPRSTRSARSARSACSCARSAG